MDVKTLCLGVLSQGDASGYEIRKYCEEGPFAHFFDAGFGSIYPALKKLGEEGLIEFVADPHPAARPDKKLYRITPRGREALQEALLETPAPDRIRSDFLFIAFFGQLLPPRRLERLIQDRLDLYRTHIERMSAEGCTCPLGGLDTPGHRFVHGFGLAIYRAAAEYLEAHRHELIEAARHEPAHAGRAAE